MLPPSPTLRFTPHGSCSGDLKGRKGKRPPRRALVVFHKLDNVGFYGGSPPAFITPPVFGLKCRWGWMHFYVGSLSDFNNTIKLPVVDRRREGRPDWGGEGGNKL